jgi:hypothetical protein
VPKLYEYFGLVVYFYSNEHLPIHVHGAFQGCESKAEILLEGGKVVKIVFTTVPGRRPLSGARLRDFRQLVNARAEEIVARWIDYFVLQKQIPSEVITRKLK